METLEKDVKDPIHASIKSIRPKKVYGGNELKGRVVPNESPY